MIYYNCKSPSTTDTSCDQSLLSLGKETLFAMEKLIGYPKRKQPLVVTTQEREMQVGNSMPHI